MSCFGGIALELDSGDCECEWTSIVSSLSCTSLTSLLLSFDMHEITSWAFSRKGLGVIQGLVRSIPDFHPA